MLTALSRSILHKYMPAFLFVVVVFSGLAAKGQCYPNYSVNKLYPSGALCSPQNIVIEARYNATPGEYLYGEFHWYHSSSDATPFQTSYIASDEILYGQISFYATDGAEVWVSYYDYNTGCESSRQLYTASFLTLPVISQTYARFCGMDNVARMQVTCNVSGVSYYLYQLINGNYQIVGYSSNGYFEIEDFNMTVQDNYYVKPIQPGGCSVNYYHLYFDSPSPNPPTITSNTAGCEGTGIELSASGSTWIYQWYDGSGNVLYEGPRYITPASLGAGQYSYQVSALSYGGCISNPATFTITVNPKPVSGTILASAATVYVDQPVTIASQSGTGEPHYWASSDGGANWNVFQDAHAGEYSFTYASNTVGTYRFHLRNKTSCGFCWDVAGGCTDFPYVDVNVIPYPAIQIGAISPAYQIITYNTTAATLSVNGVSGGDGTYTYQWERSETPAFANPALIGAATGATYTPSGLTSGGYYRLVVTSHGVKAYSQVARVDVYPKLEPNSILPYKYTVPAGSTPGKLTAGPATGGGCNSNYQYQWQISNDGVTFTDIAGVNAQGLTYEPNPVTTTTYFRRRVHCGTEDAYTNVCTINIGVIDVENLNYIRTRSFVRSGVTDPQAAAGIVPIAEVKQVTDYFDGLGRLMQTVSMQAGKNEQDLVVPVTYDQYGRQPISWLPYVASASNGNYKPNALGDLNGFHKVINGNESFYYGKTIFEPSPLNRVQKVAAAGDNWAGSDRGVENQYRINTAVDDVKIWSVKDVTDDWGTYNIDGVYPEGELFKIITVDEKGHQVIELRNKEDKLILKKVQLTAAADDGRGSGYPGWLSTYYIYDDFNSLRAVIQPAGVDLLTQNNWDITSLNGNILNEQCFRYLYDERKRVIRKKDPGSGEIAMVYDIRDRLVFTQDANQRPNNQWLGILYDTRNRQVITGLMTWTGLPASLQQTVTSQTSNGLPYDLPLQDPNTEGIYQATNSITLNEGFTTATDKNFTAEIVSAGTTTSSANVNNPIPNGAGFTLLTQTGYDTYATIPSASGVTGDLDATYTGSNYLNTAYNSFPYADPVIQSRQTNGRVTWTQAKVLGTASQYLYTVNIYDEKGRVIQAKSTNLTGGTDIITNQYTFSDQPLVSVQKQQKAGSANAQTHIVVTKITYNNLAQETAVTRSVNSTINNVAVNKPDLEIVTNEYDELGRLKIKNIGKKKDASGTGYTTDPVQTLTYDYNIRNWILGVNRNYLGVEGQTNDGILFGYELGYDKTVNKAGQAFNKSEYNGNITGIMWKSDGDDIRRKYDFTYDAANRLLRGDFIQQNADDHLWNNLKVNYNIKMGDGIHADQAYDANGNIKRMQQWGLKVTTSPQIDDMLYSYYRNGNKLSAIAEQGAAATDHKLGDFTDNNTTGNDYGYDANGNMVTDKNKRINGQATDVTNAGAITYNYMNLPQQIAVHDANNIDKGIIKYVYDALGNKLQKIVTEKNVTITYDNSPFTGDVTTTTTYLGGFVYESKAYNHADLTGLQYTDKLQFESNGDGRLRYLEASATKQAHYEYDYFIKDHLGNVRMVLTEEQKQDIYPAATLEGNPDNANDAVYTEKQFYNIDQDKIVDKSVATGITDYKNKNGGPAATDQPVNTNCYSDVTANSHKLYRLKADGGVGVTGLGITLKVMSGDKIDIYGKSYYFDNNTNGANYNVPVIDLLTGLLGAPTGATAGKAVSAQTLNGTTDIYNGLNGFLTNPNRGSGGTKPRAYVNWILFDENFKYVNGSFQRVDQPNQVEDRILPDIPVTKNGYLYVYVSNESPVPVYFDNLQVIHSHGALEEETHYYPFGLVMMGISSKAAGNLDNKFKFNGIELNNDLGIEQYDAFYRNYNPQIGRWYQTDPKPTDMESLYAGMGNNPIVKNDLLGDTSIFHSSAGEQIQRIDDGSKKNTVTVIPEDRQKGFNLIVNSSGVKDFYKDANGKFDKSAFAAALRGIGITYDYNSYFTYFDKNSKDLYTDDTYETIDNKGPLYLEHMSSVKIVDGNMGIVPGTDNPGGPFLSSTSGQGDGFIHLHPNEGRKFMGPVGEWRAEFRSLKGKPSLGDVTGDISNSAQSAGTAKFDIVVNKTTVYLYRHGAVVISISRNGTSSKNPDSIK
ncbi:DUF6443 domain-containing protein [Niastella sp. OAS944]|uniref:DUF6443 domain-containing protein n=1 Tax=Niastella sp. OAS944 TaxID=2664089 RepID=UPI003498463B|nr:RHS repeat-associated protein [Chitinophagaceae bacterium OAS944]